MVEKVYLDVLDPELVEKQTMHLLQGDKICLTIDLTETPVNSRPEKLLVCVHKLKEMGICHLYQINPENDLKYKEKIIKQYPLKPDQLYMVENICFTVSVSTIVERKVADVIAITKMTRAAGIKNYVFSLTPGSYIVYHVPNKHEYSVLLYDTGREKIILL